MKKKRKDRKVDGGNQIDKQTTDRQIERKRQKRE